MTPPTELTPERFCTATVAEVRPLNWRRWDWVMLPAAPSSWRVDEPLLLLRIKIGERALIRACGWATRSRPELLLVLEVSA